MGGSGGVRHGRGARGVGGERSVKWGMEWESYLKNANVETMVIPLLETRDAVENIDSILEVDGLETVFFGPRICRRAMVFSVNGKVPAWLKPFWR